MSEASMKKLLTMRTSIQRKMKTQAGRQQQRTEHNSCLKHLQSLIQTFSSVWSSMSSSYFTFF